MTTSFPLTAGSTEPALLGPATLATLGGMATAVLIVVDSVHAATGWTSAWFPLTLAIALALVVELTLAPTTGASRPRAVRVALAVINGCLVFTTALGGNQVANRAAGVQAPQPQISIRASSSSAPAPDRPFFHDWLR